MVDVFVSYKAEDRKRVRPLVEALENDGLSVWWDAQIDGGEEWREAITENLDAARAVVVIWSKHSVGPDGDFVRDEASRAKRRGAYVPVRIDRVQPPLGFGETQAIDMRGWKGNRSDRPYQTLLEVARDPVGARRRRAPDLPAGAMVDRRKAMIGGGAAAGIAIIGAGGWILFRPRPATAARSIAVLPFANLSGDKAETYFADGIAEELRRALARLAGVKVVGRISSEAVRDDDAKTVARKLQVANVLTGTVRESPSTIRITAELIDGRTGIDRWSDDYDRPPGDAIKIQTDIAENVATALAATLGIAARAAITVGGTSIAGAQKLVIEARAIAREGTKAARQHAMDLVDAAIRLDPNYADAYAQKAMMLNSYANNFATGADELAKDRAEAMRLAQNAVRIAPKLATGHAATAQIFQSKLEMAQSASEFQRAVDLAPGDADIAGRYLYLVARLGRPAEALQMADRLITLDPLNHLSYENRVSALYDIRRYQEGLDYAEKIRRKAPDLFRAPGLIADCLLELGRAQEAWNAYGLLIPGSWQELNGQTLALIRAGDRLAALKNLAKFQQRYGEANSYQYAGIYARLGDRGSALSALEHAFAMRDGGCISIKIDPRLDTLRGDPRFEAVVKAMNFPA